MSGSKLLTRQRGHSAWLRHLIPRDRIWRLIDAKDQVLGRVAGQIALILQGKHKPTYLDNMFSGDPVIVINARHVSLTGRKHYNKLYIHHSGYPGGLKRVPIDQVRERRPDDIIRLAVKNMLPGNKLRAVMMNNLRIYQDDKHDHHSQNPVLVAPAHCCKRLGWGGPPTIEELHQWWLDNIHYECEDTLREIFEETRQELKPLITTRCHTIGLANALEIDPASAPSQAELDASRAYITAANKALKEPPVIIPSQFV